MRKVAEDSALIEESRISSKQGRYLDMIKFFKTEIFSQEAEPTPSKSSRKTPRSTHEVTNGEVVAEKTPKKVRGSSPTNGNGTELSLDEVPLSSKRSTRSKSANSTPKTKNSTTLADSSTDSASPISTSRKRKGKKADTNGNGDTHNGDHEENL